MPMHTGPRRTSRTNTNSDGNEFRAMNILYRQQLPTLHELFPGWSREDLVAAMNEANGDLELAIGRIMEGHTNQWDQVKSKKSKPSASSTGGIQTTIITRKLDEQSGVKGITRGGKSRHGKSRGKSGDKVQWKKKENEGPRKHIDDEKEKKPSWASILKGSTKTEIFSSESITTPISNNNTVKMAIEPDETDENADHDKTINTTKDLLSTNQQITKESESADIIVEQPDDSVDNGQQSIDANNTDNDITPSSQVASDLEGKTMAITTTITTITTTSTTSTAEELGNQDSQQLVGFRKVPVRRLKQEEPVILPGGGHGLENVSLQFGSLNLNNDEQQSIDEGNQQGEKQQQQQQQTEESNTKAKTSSVSTSKIANTIHNQFTTTAAVSLNTTTQVSSTSGPSETSTRLQTTHMHQAQLISKQDFASQSVPQSQQYQQILQSQQQYSTAPTTDAHIYPYATYIPNPLPGNGHSHNFAHSTMTTLPDHYNHERQNSANYSNSNDYNQSPSINNSQLYNLGKYSNLQEGMEPSPVTHGMIGNGISTSTLQMPQQPQGGTYGGNSTSYDSYYYTLNQYQSYQHIGYQTPTILQQHHHQVPQQSQQQQQYHHQHQHKSKQTQSSYVNPNMYPMYGNQNYTNQQPYDAGMLQSNETQGLVYDKQQYQPSKIPEMQQYFDKNNSQVQHTDIGHIRRTNPAMVVDFEKQQGVSMPQLMVAHNSYQSHYQQYQQQQLQHQQQSFHHHQSYNSNTTNNTINAYSNWQNQPQHAPFWQPA